MFQTKVVEEIKTHHFVFNIFFYKFFFFENRVGYETKWKYMAEPGRPQMTI
jgi:hypothetical protein